MPPINAITTLTIKGFRGFSSEKSISFAQPNGAPGSGLTTIVGPNNSGKSSIAEAITAVTQDNSSPPTFSEGKRNKSGGDAVRITVTDINGNTRVLRTVDSGGSETVFEGDITQPPENQIFTLQSRRSFSPFFGKSSQERAQYINNTQQLKNTREGQGDLSSRIFYINNTEGKRADFELVLAKVLDPLPLWTIEQTDQGNYYLKYSYGTHSHSSDGLGEGLLSIFYIVDALYDSSPGSVVVIDEPELSLHPQLQTRVKNLLLEYSANRQIIISTHSPKFISWESISNGATIVRVTNGDEGIQINQLDEPARLAISGYLSDVNNPHTLGLQANEAFFLFDKVVLVEGQEDVMFFPKVLQSLELDLDGALFGWGVGGADKMHLIATILNSLGFKKVAGILDGDKATEVLGLNRTFEQYFFTAHPADDIRKKVKYPDKSSLLNDDYSEVRTEFQKMTREMLNQVNSYLNNGKKPVVSKE